MEESHWVDETTLEVRLRKGLRYQDGEEFSAESFRRAFEEVQRVMLEANRDHWNTERGPRLERVVFRNDLSPAEALELVGSGEGRSTSSPRSPPPTPGGSRPPSTPSWSGSTRCGS